MAEWLWEARAEADVLTDAIDSVMDQLHDVLNDASRRFRIRLCIEESLVQDLGNIRSLNERMPHTIEVRSNRREFTIGINSKFTRFTFPNT